jgi:hypothetical protein
MHKKYDVSLGVILSIIALKANGVQPIYPSHILGRDLIIPGASWVGHVGIAWSDDVEKEATQVIEALNEKPAIKKNTIQDFKSRSKYWGSRYGIADRAHYLPIVEAANYQLSDCARYAMTADFEPGTKDSTGKPLQCAKFRCDTFVNYVYHIAGYDLPTYTGFWPSLPRTVFMQFPFENGNKSYSYNISQINPRIKKPKKIKKITPENVIAVLESTAGSIPDRDRIKQIWEIAQNTDLETEKRLYLIDYLSIRGTVDLIPEFIRAYFKEENLEIKSKLLQSTEGLYQKHIKDSEDSKEKTILKEFYATLLNEQLPTQDSDIVLRGIIRLCSTRFVEDHVDSISALLNSEETDLPGIVKIGLNRDLIMKSKNLEKLFLPDLINELKNKNNLELDGFFNDWVVGLLGNVGLDALDESSKKMIGSYLQSNQHKNEKQTVLFNDSIWLEAFALVHASSYKEAGKWIADFLINKDLTEQAYYIVWFSKTNYIKEIFKTEPVFKNFIKMANQRLNTQNSMVQALGIPSF